MHYLRRVICRDDSSQATDILSDRSLNFSNKFLVSEKKMSFFSKSKSEIQMETWCSEVIGQIFEKALSSSYSNSLYQSPQHLQIKPDQSISYRALHNNEALCSMASLAIAYGQPVNVVKSSFPASNFSADKTYEDVISYDGGDFFKGIPIKNYDKINDKNFREVINTEEVARKSKGEKKKKISNRLVNFSKSNHSPADSMIEESSLHSSSLISHEIPALSDIKFESFSNNNNYSASNPGYLKSAAIKKSPSVAASVDLYSSKLPRISRHNEQQAPRETALRTSRNNKTISKRSIKDSRKSDL